MDNSHCHWNCGGDWWRAFLMDSSGICVFGNKVSCQISVCRVTCWQEKSEVMRTNGHWLMWTSRLQGYAVFRWSAYPFCVPLWQKSAYSWLRKVRTLRGTQKNPVSVELERLPDSWWWQLDSNQRPHRCERCALSPRYVCNENTRSCGLKLSKPIKSHKSRLAFSVEQIVINNESTKQFPAYHAGNIMVTFGLYG